MQAPLHPGATPTGKTNRQLPRTNAQCPRSRRRRMRDQDWLGRAKDRNERVFQGKIAVNARRRQGVKTSATELPLNHYRRRWRLEMSGRGTCPNQPNRTRRNSRRALPPPLCFISGACVVGSTVAASRSFLFDIAHSKGQRSCCCCSFSANAARTVRHQHHLVMTNTSRLCAVLNPTSLRQLCGRRMPADDGGALLCGNGD